MTIALTELPAELSAKGYAHINFFSAEELAAMRGFIRRAIKKATGVDIETLRDYHAQVTNDQHQIMASKLSRILNSEDAAAVLEFKSVKRILESFPGYRITSVVYGHLQNEERPEVYFRLVRPRKESDVGSMHCDRWFNELYEADFLESMSYKIWISIETSAGENGLFVYPQAKGLTYKRVETPDGPRPAPDFEPGAAGPELLVPTKPGDAVVFTDMMLHRGAPNAADTTRVSVEITLCKPS